MDPIFKKVILNARSVRLNKEERTSVFNSVRSFMTLKPLSLKDFVSVSKDVPNTGNAQMSVRNERFGRHRWSDGSWLSQLLTTNIKPMTALIVLLLVFSGGTSFAAQHALPGDILYPVKIHVNENVESLIAIGAKNNAVVEAKHAVARIGEAEELAAEGKLTSKTNVVIKERFSSDTGAMKRDIKKLEGKGDFKAAVKANANFEDSLDDHYSLFVGLERKATSTKPVFTEVKNLIKAELDASADARIKSEEKVIETSTKAEVDVKVAAEGAMTEAENKIKEVKQFIEAKSTSTITAAVSTSAETHESLERADKYFADGKIKLETRLFNEAFVLFKQAQKEAEQAKLNFIGSIETESEIKAILNTKNDLKLYEQNEGASANNNSSGSLKVETEMKDNASVSGNSGNSSVSSSGSGESSGALKVNLGL